MDLCLEFLLIVMKLFVKVTGAYISCSAGHLMLSPASQASVMFYLSQQVSFLTKVPQKALCVCSAPVVGTVTAPTTAQCKQRALNS